MKKPIVLIIEDEEGIHEALDVMLSEKFELVHAMNGLEGIKKAIKHRPDLIMLDLRMPDMDGFQVSKILRSDVDFDDVPIIIVSAFNSVADRTKAFEFGADDYITKPFDENELIIRMQRKIDKKIRSIESKGSSLIKSTSSFDLDANSLAFISGSIRIQLSSIEFKILKILSENFLNLVSREKILEDVWEKQEVSPRLIDPHILTIRGKIKDANLTIQSIYGKGYILKEI